MDEKHKLIVDFEVSTCPDDKGVIPKMTESAKEIMGVDEIAVTTYKGYYDGGDVEQCEENGTTCYLVGAKGEMSMQKNIDKSDLRVIKTSKILDTAMFSLLNQNTFRKITVRDICEEAQISRATFYARFADKYDFLKKWLINLKPDGLDRDIPYEEAAKMHNDNFYKNRSVIKNLISDPDNETLEILAEFILTYFMIIDKYDLKQTSAEQVVLSNFFAGGMLFYILWHVKNKFPPDIIPMNIYLYEIIEQFSKRGLDIL